MKRFLLDSGVAGDFINRRNGVVERVREENQHGRTIGIGTPVLGELYGGVLASASRERNLERLKHALSVFTIWPFDARAALKYGEVFAELRRIGRPMGDVDIQTAAIALALGGCTVVSYDRDLFAVPGLNVESWAAP